ncbi:DUF2281 domain-containing protein [Microcystis aeruginosa]|uniref:DUF2281 domain-containing protein n=1 Tax=Microcystis aeruginosa TaxID=1126 RepID=UPI002FEE55A6
MNFDIMPNICSLSLTKESVTVKRTLAGSMKGTFVLPLANDFDAPLEDFEDYR